MAPACQEETSVCRLLPAKAVSLNSEKGCVVPRLWEPAWGDSCPGHCGHRDAWQSEIQTDLANPLGLHCLCSIVHGSVQWATMLPMW